MSATVIAEYAGAAANSHTVTFTGKTNGRDLYAFFSAPATPVLPSGWVELDSVLAGGGDYYAKLWHLPRASNSSAVTSLALSLNTSAPLTCVVIQDYIDTTVDTVYHSIAQHNPVIGTPGVQGTGAHTFTTRNEVLALFAVEIIVAGETTFGTFDYTSFDNSFTGLADSGNAGGSAIGAGRTWMARRANFAFTDDGVTATANQPSNSAYSGVAGFLAYNVGTPPSGSAPVNAVAPSITTDGTPASGETVTVSAGTWDNTPTGYSFQKQLDGVDSGLSTSDADGTISYTILDADVGKSLRFRVTASNASGSNSANSNAITPNAVPMAALGVRFHVIQGSVWNALGGLGIGNARVLLWDAGTSDYLPASYRTDTSQPREFVGPTDPSTLDSITGPVFGDRWTPTAAP